jgi:DNA mismatch repair protein MutL
MPKVLVLADHIASQIAAGEVVERPSSVVKELAENALDSGATQIEVTVSLDCRDLRIADNGCGMDAEDAVLAFQRHATSKLRSVDDLWKLQSLGFRGEALPSIASVSKVSCYTRTHDSLSGHRIDAAEGKISATATGCSPGTVMEVTDLFYNVPARLSFLKKAATEFAHIQEVMQSLAVAYPKVIFHLVRDGDTAFRTTGTGELSIAVVEAGFFTGKEQLCQVSLEDPSVSVSGYIARPLHFRGDRRGILSFVNGRPVRCPLTYKALDYAFTDLIPRGRYPLAVIKVAVNPSAVDINIHPTKKEIKYSSGNDVYIMIQRALLESLRQIKQERQQVPSGIAYSLDRQEAAPSSASVYEEPLPVPALVVNEMVAEAKESSFYEPGPRRAHISEPAIQLRFKERLSYVHSTHQSGEQVGNTYHLPADWRIAGYLHDTYILIETPEGLEIIEQHIAHERTIYERLLARQATAGRTTDYSQQLIISSPLNLSASQTETLREQIDPLRKLGFDFDIEGDQSTCTQVPLELAHRDYAGAVQDLLDQIATADSGNLELEATKSIACQSAIKNGMPLSERDMVKLLAEWIATPRNDTCPHGRPIRLKFSSEKLFQLFHPA